MNINDLVAELRRYNLAYRRGDPLISDQEYDALLNELKLLDPNHSFLNQVEPEALGTRTLPLPERMLSTQKTYAWAGILDWMTQVSVTPAAIIVTPKIDGFSAYLWHTVEGWELASRGDGETGTDYSHALGRLKFPCDERRVGPGEITILRGYFKQHLSGEFKNSRNVIAAVLKESELHPLIAQAVKDGAFYFIPFSSLRAEFGRLLPENEEAFMNLFMDVRSDFAFETDGLVLEFTDPGVKHRLGSTLHHHRWQIAFKQNTEVVHAKVVNWHLQTGRTGKITPVINIEPVEIGGVTVRRATAHNFHRVVDWGIGPDAEVKLVRAGSVIPHVEEVIKPAGMDNKELIALMRCPSCGERVTWYGADIYCMNRGGCPAQLSGAIVHFFQTVGECNGFGPSIAGNLAQYFQEKFENPSFTTILPVLLTHSGVFTDAGFSPGIAFNLGEAVRLRREKRLHPAKLLAALGIPGIGEGAASKIIARFPFAQIPSIYEEDFRAIEDIGEVKAAALTSWMTGKQELFDNLARLFALREDNLERLDGPLMGKAFCFSGAMPSGRTRSEMHHYTLERGGSIHASVSSKTDFLVTGDNVGANKLEAARKKGAAVLTELQFSQLVDSLTQQK